jgi:hypothetical protein
MRGGKPAILHFLSGKPLLAKIPHPYLGRKGENQGKNEK